TLSGTSSGIVPLQLSDGAELSVGMRQREPHGLDVPITPILDGRIRLSEGPHAELFPLQVLKQLLTKSGWTVSPSSNRIGVRLASSSNNTNSLVDELNSNSLGELDSMALVRGAMQLMPSGELVVMLADHPTTGGYPVIAVVHADDVDVMGQRSPGAMVNMVWTD
ncbi:MAG: hypothetical protein ACO3CX_04980, partial [Ilumatobacteraceae bacterium]